MKFFLLFLQSDLYNCFHLDLLKILLIHKDVKQAERLVNYFQGKCDIFIHVDRESDITDSDIKKMKTMPGVIDVYHKYKIHWGGFSILKTVMFMLKRAIEYSDFSYVHLLSRQTTVIVLG